MEIGPGSPCCMSKGFQTIKDTLTLNTGLVHPFSFSAMYYLVLYQLTSYYSDSELLRCVVQPPKIACAVIGATVIKICISNGDFGVLITVLESEVIPIVDHLLDSPILPAIASDVQGLIFFYHLSRGLKEQPI